VLVNLAKDPISFISQVISVYTVRNCFTGITV